MQPLNVWMEIFILLVDLIKAELKFVIVTSGAQYVMTAGMTEMLEWLADNWDSNHLVCLCYCMVHAVITHYSVPIKFCWTGGTASGLNFNTAPGAFFLDDLHCLGNEATLLNCTHNGIAVHSCISSEIAGVVCRGNSYHIHPSCMSYAWPTISLHTMQQLHPTAQVVISS